jgi:hypothetical protein
MGDAVTLGNTFLATINEILSHLCTGDIVTIHIVSCNMLWDKLLQVANQWAMYTIITFFHKYVLGAAYCLFTDITLCSWFKSYITFFIVYS